MTKNTRLNEGLPIFVDHKTDVGPISKAPSDSWYVNCAFEADGKQLGFMWHQQTMKMGPISVNFAELLLLNATDNYSLSELAKPKPISIKKSSENEVEVVSSIGSFSGSYRDGFDLQLQIQDGGVHVHLKPDTTLYNGTTGLLPLVGSDSHEFAYPNMSVTGAVTMNNETYELSDVTAWFDKQWVTKAPNRGEMNNAAWLWLGLPLNTEGTCSISLWDYYTSEHRNAFATVVEENGMQETMPIYVTYNDIWRSQKTGNSYPKTIDIRIDEIDLNLSLRTLIDDTEFYQERAKLGGCQNLCEVTGTFRQHKISKYCVVEMINDICGD